MWSRQLNASKSRLSQSDIPAPSTLSFVPCDLVIVKAGIFNQVTFLTNSCAEGLNCFGMTGVAILIVQIQFV